MVRPRICRKINFKPNVDYFKPRGVPVSALEVVKLNPDELEAARLKNIEGLEQKEAAKKMGVSQSTFQRILAEAHKKITQALVEGKAIEVQK